MTHTVLFSDQAFDELCRAPTPSGISQQTSNEYRQQFPPPIIILPPPGGIPSHVPGFDKVQGYRWDWTAPGGGGMSIYTGLNQLGQMNPQGPLGPNGIVIIEFVATAANASSVGEVSIAPYPGDISSAIRTTSISTKGGDFSMPVSVWKRSGLDQGIQFTVGDYIPDVYASLVPGGTYYINICNRDAQGNSGVPPGERGEFHVQASRPR